MKKIFISILNFNGKENTIACLDSLKSLKRDSFELTIIAINNSSKENFDLKSGYLKDIPLIVINNKENLGFAGGHNVAIEYAIGNGADYVLILNNDTYVDKDFIEELFKVAEKDSKIGILTPKIYFAPGFEFHKNRYSKKDLGKVFWYAGGEMDWQNVIGHHRGVDEVDMGQYDKTEGTEIATGCCMMVKKQVFDKIGLFDEKFYLYYEDADLSEKTKKAGYKIVYAPKAVIWHKNAGSVGGSGSKLQDYYITRNRLLFGLKHAPFRAKMALLKESVKLLTSGRYWQKRGVVDFYLNRFEKGSFNP